ncbi:MAG: methyl-accepting chemotaxis protein [Pseudomonadota bacterium]|tara:strand:- start:1972 stop:3516 length:1545 start_codon:yes stop_codon:yes gene_type:complete
MIELADLQRRGICFIVLVGWAANAVLAALALFKADTDSLIAVTIGCILNVIPTLFALRRSCDLDARLTTGMMIAIEPALLVFIMRGDAWQLDMHMYFFVALATLTVLCDWRPLVVASAIIALHHGFLSFAAAHWVFSGGGGLPRVMIHGIAVVLQCAILSYIASRLRATIITQSATNLRTEQLAAEATAARMAAEEAKAFAEAALASRHLAEASATAEREKREVLEANAARARQAEMLVLAAQFEQSITDVAGALANSAKALDGSAVTLNEVAQDTGRQSLAVSAAARQSTEAAQSVAGGVSHLSKSIAVIAASVAEQADLAESASARSTLGDAAIQNLASSTFDVGGLANGIATIASQTNLLALNASIEAARAGDAGRGFSVVAQEVKALAGEAGSATIRISRLVSDINARANDANTNFQQVSLAIGNLGEAASAIQKEIEQQKNATRDIEYHAQEAASGMDIMSHRIADVSRTATTAESLSFEVKTAAKELLSQAERLQKATATFVSVLKAA